MVDRDQVRAAYTVRTGVLGTLSRSIEEGIKQSLDDLPHIDRIVVRVKHPDRFLEKATSGRYEHPLEEVEDQVAARVLVFFPSDVEAVTQRLREWFVPVEETRREPAHDAEFGYESFHQVFVISDHLKPAVWQDLDEPPNTFEVQIRTLFMHAYAEPQHGFGYTRGTALPREIKRRLAWIAASAWGADQAYLDIVSRVAEQHAARAVENGGT